MKFVVHAILLVGSSLICFNTHAQRQGIKGQVFWLDGNKMPGVRTETAPTLGIQREIFLYKLTTLQETNQENAPFFSNITSELVTKMKTKKDGSFKIKLPPGAYSLFIQEPKGLFANVFNANSEINRVDVKDKKFTWVSITVDYEAAY